MLNIIASFIGDIDQSFSGCVPLPAKQKWGLLLRAETAFVVLA
ncbi:MAG: hypothetical protein OFPI_37910 [Osedax symbiont Rs2]|nr:MAG: hypothetical protein OFPI_37910 [Osedax symbiont Rs2]